MSDYLPHARVQGMAEAQDVLDQMLADYLDEFDAVVCCGMSGDPAVVWAYRHDKYVVRVRKHSDQSHGTPVEGRFGGGSFIIIDDFISTGKTLDHILDVLQAEYHSKPEYIVFYNTSREYRRVWTDAGRNITVNSAGTFSLDKKLTKFAVTYSTKGLLCQAPNPS